jgi:hypothetical protein
MLAISPGLSIAQNLGNLVRLLFQLSAEDGCQRGKLLKALAEKLAQIVAVRQGVEQD